MLLPVTRKINIDRVVLNIERSLGDLEDTEFAAAGFAYALIKSGSGDVIDFADFSGPKMSGRPSIDSQSFIELVLIDPKTFLRLVNDDIICERVHHVGYQKGLGSMLHECCRHGAYEILERILHTPHLPVLREHPPTLQSPFHGLARQDRGTYQQNPAGFDAAVRLLKDSGFSIKMLDEAHKSCLAYANIATRIPLVMAGAPS